MNNRIVLFSLLILSFITGCTLQNTTPSVSELNQNWQFRQAGTQEWMPASVPGCVHTDLMANKKIQDPFYRMNEKDVQWVDKKDWEYKTVFVPDKDLMKKENKYLVFKGLDTYADVFLNDSLILSADNMFREWTVDVSSLLKKGKNELRVYLKSPITEGLKKLDKWGFPLPASNDLSEIGGVGDKRVSVFTRKAPYHFGWDWGPRLVTSGIWRPIILKGWDRAQLTDLFIRQNEVTKENASLTAVFAIQATSDEKATLVVMDDSKKVVLASMGVELKKGSSRFELPFTIQKPELWWTNGLGKQSLYAFKGSVNINSAVADERIVKTGIRSLHLIRKADANGQGESFYFELNGVPVFMKGANYIPNDAFLTRVTPDRYEKAVKDAVSANMNMLRVWGGGIYENDLFYNLCDQYGLLVWQDFMFACSMYPGDSAFMDNVKEEAVQNVTRLRNHPCMALWCGNNEIETAWDTWGWQKDYNVSQKAEIEKAYNKLFNKILPEVIKAYDPGSDYWPSTPSKGPSMKGENDREKDVSYGDVHMWEVWHGKKPFEYYGTYIGRFMTEYGFQSFPEMRTIKSFTISDDWSITSPVMNWHQRSAPGNMLIKTYMDMYYHPAKDFNTFLYLNQVLQAEGIKEAMEAHRRARPWCMGTIYWQLNDCWPGPSWSGRDYYGRWKALHYFARKAYQTFLVSPVVEKDSFKIYVVSDSLSGIKGKLTVRVMDLDGKDLRVDTSHITIPANMSQVVFGMKKKDFLKGMDPSKILVETILTKDNVELSSNLFNFVPFREVKLIKPAISVKVLPKGSNYEITLSTDKPALNVCLTSANGDGWFSDNYFNLLPGKEVTVRFVPSESCQGFEKGLSVISLVDSY